MTYGAYHGDIEKVEHSEERVEAVARAIFAASGIEDDVTEPVTFETMGLEDRAFLDRLARAALSALPVGGGGEVRQLAESDLMPLAWALQNVHGYLTDNSCGDPECCGGPHYDEAEYTDGLAVMAQYGLALQHSVPSVGGSEK